MGQCCGKKNEERVINADRGGGVRGDVTVSPSYTVPLLTSDELQDVNPPSVTSQEDVRKEEEEVKDEGCAVLPSVITHTERVDEGTRTQTQTRTHTNKKEEEEKDEGCVVLPSVITLTDGGPRTQTQTRTHTNKKGEKKKDEACAVLPSPSPTPPLPSSPQGKFLNYPILKDRKSIEYVVKSKVMVILRGLPGSGKSYIAEKLKQLYRDDVAICSADHYFMKGGEYNFSVDKLKLAHESCQQEARKAAMGGVSLIIIDNTNLQTWNYKYYLKLTKTHCYTPVIMEPHTPWARNTRQLARRNAHSIEKEVLDQKMKKTEAALPVYYWWFLNEQDSLLILTTAQEWMRKSLQVQEFFKDFSEFSKLSSVEDMMRYYKRNEGAGDYKVLHATASVTRKGKAKNAEEYMSRKAVRFSLGKTYTLHVVGFVITPRTFGVRLRLEDKALEVWGMDDQEEEEEEGTEDKAGTAAAAASSKPPQRAVNKATVSISETGLREGSCGSTLRTGDSLLRPDRYHPTSGLGSRAHLTLGCGPGVRAVATGFDLMKVISREQRVLKGDSSGQYKSFSIPGGELRTYGDGLWVVYPENELDVSSMFSGFY